MHRPLLPLLLLGLMMLTTLSGCGIFRGAGGELALRGETGQTIDLGGAFDRGLYSYNGQDTLTVVLIQGTLDAPKRAVTARLYWRPKAGSTPIDPTATNTTVRYLDFTAAGDASNAPAVRVYSGAGFMYLDSTPGEPTLSAGLWDTALRLTDASGVQSAAELPDELGEAQLTGRIRAERDDAAVLQTLRQLNHLVTRALDYPRMVRGDRISQ